MCIRDSSCSLLHDLAISNRQNSPRMIRNRGFMGDHHDGDTFFIQFVEKLHNLLPRLGIQGACGLIRQ